MSDLKEQIKKELQILEKMIEKKEERRKIEVQRKRLDELLEEYLKDM